jgi:hypothetical protein
MLSAAATKPWPRISRIGRARSHDVEFVLALTLNWLASARTAFCVGDEDILPVV